MEFLVNYKDIEPKSKDIFYNGYILNEYYCVEPDCVCNKVRLIFNCDENNNLATGFSVNFMFDTLETEFTAFDNESSEEAVQGIIRNQDYIKQFKEHYAKAKLYGLSNREKAKANDEFVRNCIDKKGVISYNKLFSQDAPDQIIYKNKAYFIYDEYCPVPGCNCRYVLFSFIFIDADNGKHQAELSVRWFFDIDEWDIMNKACSYEQADMMISELKLLNLSLYKERYQKIKFRSLIFFTFRPEQIPRVVKIQEEATDFATLLSIQNAHFLNRAFGVISGKRVYMRKKPLIQLIDENYLEYLPNILESLTTEMLDFIYKLIDNGENDEKEVEWAKFRFLNLSLIGFTDYRNSIKISNKVREALGTVRRESLYQKAAVNDLIIKYVRTLLKYYGQVPLTLLIDYLDRYEQSKYRNLIMILTYDSEYSDLYMVNPDNIESHEFSNIKDIKKIIDAHKDIDYVKLTKEEILNLRETDSEQELRKYLENSAYFNKEQAEGTFEYIIGLINSEKGFDDIEADLSDIHLPKSIFDRLKRLTLAVFETIPRYSLKGHTLKELKPKAENPVSFDKSLYTRIK